MKASLMTILHCSGSMDVSMVSEMVRGVGVLCRGFMSALLQRVRKVEVAKEQLHM